MSTSQTMTDNESELRTKMKRMLSLLPDGHQDVFRRMYNHEGKFKHSVDGVKSDKLDWAFYQIENGLKKLGIKA